VVWSISNPYLCWYNYKKGEEAQYRFFLVMMFVSLIGVYNLW